MANGKACQRVGDEPDEAGKGCPAACRLPPGRLAGPGGLDGKDEHGEDEQQVDDEDGVEAHSQVGEGQKQHGAVACHGIEPQVQAKAGRAEDPAACQAESPWRLGAPERARQQGQQEREEGEVGQGVGDASVQGEEELRCPAEGGVDVGRSRRKGCQRNGPARLGAPRQGQHEQRSRGCMGDGIHGASYCLKGERCFGALSRRSRSAWALPWPLP